MDEDFYYYTEQIDLLEYKIDKYKTALDEIEEMCKHDCEYECSNDNTKCGICSCLEQRIQRKINQAKKGEEENQC